MENKEMSQIKFSSSYFKYKKDGKCMKIKLTYFNFYIYVRITEKISCKRLALQLTKNTQSLQVYV